MSKSSERITEKRTVITSSSSAYDDNDDSVYYKSGITPRQSSTVVSRSSVGPGMRSSIGSSSGGGGGTVYTRTVEYGIGRSAGLGNLSPGSFEKVSNTGVMNVKSTREREKKDMQDLNERFANYIEKVRFLEAQNRKLASELEHLKTKWGKETSAIKSMYEQELAEARKLIDDITREKNKLEIQNNSLQEEMANLRRQMDDLKKYHAIDQEQINKLNQQVSDYEAEINMLRRTISSLETERARDKDRINKLQGEVDKLRIDLNNETLNHLDAENRRQSLEEEMEFLKKVHEQELKELAALAYRDTTEENREFWKSELSQAIRDIQNEYDNKVDQIRGDMESYYNLKVQEFRTGATKQNMEVTHVKEENKKLVKNISDLKGRLADLEARNAQLESQYNSLLREYESIQSEHTMETVKLKEEITNLRAEMEAILVELQTLMDAKLSLELEIAAYRKLLESEESRVERLRRLGINVRNMRSAFRESPIEYKPEPSYEYSGNVTIDDEQTEKDITPDDEMQIDIGKQSDDRNDEIVETKSREEEGGTGNLTELKNARPRTPEEVREIEVISSKVSNVTISSPPQYSHGDDKGDSTESKEELVSTESTTNIDNKDSDAPVDVTIETKEVNAIDTKPDVTETHKEVAEIKSESIAVDNQSISKISDTEKEEIKNVDNQSISKISDTEKEEIKNVKSEVNETQANQEDTKVEISTVDDNQKLSDQNIENQTTNESTGNDAENTTTGTATNQIKDVDPAIESQNKTEVEVKQDSLVADGDTTDTSENQKRTSENVNISDENKQKMTIEQSDKNEVEDSKTDHTPADVKNEARVDHENKITNADDRQQSEHSKEIKSENIKTDTNQERQPEKEEDKANPTLDEDDAPKKSEDLNVQSSVSDQNLEKHEDPTKSGDIGNKVVESKLIETTDKPSENTETGNKSVEAVEIKVDDSNVNELLSDKPDMINGDDDGTTDGDRDEQDSHSSMKMMRGEVSAKTTYQKTSTGPVSISEVNQDGKFITLENTSSQRREVNLDGWKIRRELDNDREIVYTFRNFTLKPHKSVKIVARGAASEAGINDLVFRDEDSWGVGSQVNTTLVNEKGEEKATHRQRVNYN